MRQLSCCCGDIRIICIKSVYADINVVIGLSLNVTIPLALAWDNSSIFYCFLCKFCAFAWPELELFLGQKSYLEYVGLLLLCWGLCVLRVAGVANSIKFTATNIGISTTVTGSFTNGVAVLSSLKVLYCYSSIMKPAANLHVHDISNTLYHNHNSYLCVGP